MKRTDVTIIGAGAIGLAVAVELKRPGRKVMVVEQHSTFGQESSSRNSGVIHAGIYYPKDSLKARLCVEGNRLLYQMCEETHISCKRLGKLVVATDSKGVDVLKRHLQRGNANGVKGLRLLSRREIDRYGPTLKAVGALFSASTGILDTHSLMSCLEFKAVQRGVVFSYDSKVIDIEKRLGGYVLDVLDTNGERMQLRSDIVINSAGLFSDTIASMLGLNVQELGYSLSYSKGEYFRLADASTVPLNVLVYPATAAGVGIHTLVCCDGEVKLGPKGNKVEKPLECSVDTSHKREVYEACKRFLPLLRMEDMSPDIAGISPRRQQPETDFIIAHEEEKGFPGFVNLIAMDSPALTACLAIAKYVNQLI